jgi:two-component system, OmpR family, KDP operon response regulator KdpE
MAGAATVLVADDERGIARLLTSELELAGYRVLVAEDGVSAVNIASAKNPDVVILDIMMPGKDGFAVCEEIRGFSYAPIIVLSARGQERDKVRALNLGADDYLTKPFGMGELLARVRAAVRRAQIARGEVQRAPLRAGHIHIDFAARQVFKREKPVKLTATEYKLLCALCKQPGRAMAHETLLGMVWGPEYTDQTEYLWVYIGRLRNRLEEDPATPRIIVTVPGAGYRFEREPHLGAV